MADHWHFSKSGIAKVEDTVRNASFATGMSRYSDVCMEPFAKSRVRLVWDDAPHACLIIKKRGDAAVTSDTVEMATWLQTHHGVKVLVEPTAHHDMPGFAVFNPCATLPEGQAGDPSNVDDLSAAVDFVVCVGGDGTLLHLNALFLGTRPVPPVIAFNRGSMGFLTPFSYENYKHDFASMFGGKLFVTLRRRLVFNAFVNKKEVNPKVLMCQDPEEGVALNEIVLNRGSHPYMVNLELYVNDVPITSILADGVIVATATGSTAYSLSAGGPMCHPLLSGMLLTPIAPHSLSTRPLVLPDNCEIKLKVSSDARVSAFAYYDGNGPIELMQNDYILVRLSVNMTDEITDWFNSLAHCLHWNSRHPQASQVDPVFQNSPPTPKIRPARSPDPTKLTEFSSSRHAPVQALAEPHPIHLAVPSSTNL